MSLKGRKTFIRKTGTGNNTQIYRWTPFEFNKKLNKPDDTTGFFCVTNFGTQGNDFIVTYSYNIVFINGKETRTAYVQCDYWE
jgi:hypothetical protein